MMVRDSPEKYQVFVAAVEYLDALANVENMGAVLRLRAVMAPLTAALPLTSRVCVGAELPIPTDPALK